MSRKISDELSNEIPSSREYKNAFSILVKNHNISQKEIKLLQFHYYSNNHTIVPIDLAKKIGYSSHASINRIYGGLGKKIAKILSLNLKYKIQSLIKYLHKDVLAEEPNKWILRTQVIDALKELKIVEQPIIGDNYFNEFDKNVIKSTIDNSDSRRKRLKNAEKDPSVIQVIRNEFKRNPDVVAEVLSRASGFCELCKCEAPFIKKSDKTPYLEVHHKIPLAEGGEDTVMNAQALCPNCHRKIHFGITS